MNKIKKVNRDIALAISGLHIREAEGEEESRVVEGHAVIFGERSVNLVPWSSYREIYEIMEPGCISQDLLDNADVVLTAFHNNELIMGRCRGGEGTLELILEDGGLLIRCELPHTSTADDMLELIRRGDISGMSFCYTTDEDDSENCVSYEMLEKRSEDGKEVWLRHVKRVTGIYDVTIAGHPAYQGTDISNREQGADAENHIQSVVSAADEKDRKDREAAARRARMIQLNNNEIELSDY